MAQTRPLFSPAKLPVVYHPGETLEEKLQEMEMSVREFASKVSLPEKTVMAVIDGKKAINQDMAVAFESATKIPATMWLHMQSLYDKFLIRKKRASLTRAARTSGIKTRSIVRAAASAASYA